MIYDYDYADDDEHFIIIFEIKGGKVVGYAESHEEALKKIELLELAKELGTTLPNG